MNQLMEKKHSYLFKKIILFAYIFFLEQPCVFFVSIDLSHYFIHKILMYDYI